MANKKTTKGTKGALMQTLVCVLSLVLMRNIKTKPGGLLKSRVSDARGVPMQGEAARGDARSASPNLFIEHFRTHNKNGVLFSLEKQPF